MVCGPFQFGPKNFSDLNSLRIFYLHTHTCTRAQFSVEKVVFVVVAVSVVVLTLIKSMNMK